MWGLGMTAARGSALGMLWGEELVCKVPRLLSFSLNGLTFTEKVLVCRSYVCYRSYVCHDGLSSRIADALVASYS